MTMPGTPETGAPPAAEGTPTAPPAGAPPAAPPAEVDLDAPLTETHYDRAYVEKLRAEAAANRIKARDAQAAFDKQFEGLEDRSDFEYLLAMARKLNDDPHGAHADLEGLTKRLAEDLGITKKQAEAIVNGDDDPNRPLTRADLEKIEYDREVERQQRLIASEAEALSGDDYKFVDGNPEYAQLIWLVVNDKDVKGAPNKLEAAAAKMRARDAAIREEAGKAAVAAYVEQVRTGAASFPPAGTASAAAAPAGAGAPSGRRDFKSASESAFERISKGLGQL